MNRRELLIALAAGAVVAAEGLWVPGKKLISIPKHRSIYVFNKLRVGAHPSEVWPGIEKWFYDKYNEEVVRQMIYPQELFSTP